MTYGSIALKLTAALIVACLSGASSAIAQQANVHQLRGAVLGMSLQAFKQLPDGDLLCSDDRPEAYASLSLAQRPGFVLCGTIRPFARGLEDAANSIADFELSLLYFFVHDATLPWNRPHLFAINGNFERIYFQAVLEALLSRWRGPSVARTNAYVDPNGAPYRGQLVRWRGQQSSITLQEHSGDRQTSGFQFLHTSLGALAKRLYQAKP